jgi:cytochrome c oxidase cbb3-type subunit 4
MDVDVLRTIVTVLAFTAFVGVVLWAYGRGSRRGFDEASRLPFAGNEGDDAADRKP